MADLIGGNAPHEAQLARGCDWTPPTSSPSYFSFENEDSASPSHEVTYSDNEQDTVPIGFDSVL